MISQPFCDGVTRRDFLKVGALAGIGLSLSEYFALADAGAVANARGRAAIFVRLGGGPSHLDTFDMKPDAPETHRGEFKEIARTFPASASASICRAFAEAGEVRGVSHTLAAHELGSA